MNGEVKQNYELAEIDYMNGMKYKEIAAKYNVSINTVKSWKTRYKWSKDNKKGVHTKSKKVRTQKGGQPGNKNAVGHGGTGPPKNKNAVKTGEFETLLFDCMDPEELQLANSVPLDKEQLLLQEIQLLTVREHRMLKRIEGIKNTVEHLENGTVVDGMTMVSFKSGLEKGHITELKEYQGKLGQIQAIEDALTRVQARKQRAIETLHKFGYDDAHLELETMKFEMELLKQGGEDENTDDDGFLDAMNATAADVWGDEDV
mgnify:CR=1 FL=1